MIFKKQSISVTRSFMGYGSCRLSHSGAMVSKPRRSYLYVPSSSQKMLQKSISVSSDMIIYDLEDSVAPSQKAAARRSLLDFFRGQHERSIPERDRVAVRLNGLATPHFEEDLTRIVQCNAVGTIVLPKIHSPQDLDTVASVIQAARHQQGLKETSDTSLRIVASIESAKALWFVGDIAQWMPKTDLPGVSLTTLMFAAEDYCADTSIIRTPSRRELLYTRSQIVAAAKAFELEALDMVCVDYKNKEYLQDECDDGRKLGYDGKQAIHPDQVETINRTFLPAPEEILRAAKIVHQMERYHQSHQGAFGLDSTDGGKEMIDAPMLLQAQNLLRTARAAGLDIPEVK